MLTVCRQVAGKICPVKVTSEIRRENFAALVAKHGGVQAASDRLQKDKAQVYQWLAEPGVAESARNIGPKSVREIEDAYSLPRGWMDREHVHDTKAGTADTYATSQEGRMDPLRLRDAMAILSELAKEQIGPESGGFAHDYRFIAITYNYLLSRNEPVGESNVTEIRRGVAAAIRTELSSAPQERNAA